MNLTLERNRSPLRLLRSNLMFKLMDHFMFGNVACFKGGGATSSTNYTTSLPEYAEPFYTNMMEKAEAVSNEPYQAYDQPRIAGFTPDQTAAFGGIEDLAATGNPTLDQSIGYSGATNALLLNQAMQPDAIQNTYGMAPSYAATGYGPYMVDAEGRYVDAGGLDVGTDLWNAQWRDQYMSPYMDAVIQKSQEDAILEDARAKKLRDTEAVMAGAFGGDRRFVSDALYGESLQDRLSDIQVRGLQSAYENAQGMFTSDMARRLQADMANQGVGLQAGLGNLDAYLRGEMANQQAAQEAAGLREQSRQFGAGLTEEGRQFGTQMDYQTALANEDLRLQALQQLLGGTELMGQLGIQDQQALLERIGALQGAGSQQQAMQQDIYDQAYEDFLNQRDYDRASLNWLSGLLHGVPVTPQQNVIAYEPQPNLISQMLGSGIAGYGLWNSMNA